MNEELDVRLSLSRICTNKLVEIIEKSNLIILCAQRVSTFREFSYVLPAKRTNFSALFSLRWIGIKWPFGNITVNIVTALVVYVHGGFLNVIFMKEIKFIGPLLIALSGLVCFATVAQSNPENDVVIVGSVEKLKQNPFGENVSSYPEMMSFIKQHVEDPKTVVKHVERFLSQVASLDLAQRIELLKAKSSAHQSLQNYQLAIESITQIFKLQPSMEPARKFSLELRLAELYKQNNDYFIAIEKTKRAFELSLKALDLRQSVIIALQVSNLYSHVKDNEQANHWLKKSENLAQIRGNEITNIVFQLQKSRWHIANNELFLAEQAAKASAEMARRLRLMDVSHEAGLLLSEIYLLGKKFFHAEPILQSLFDIAKYNRNRGAQFEVLLNIVDHQIAQGKYKLAESYWKSAEKLQGFGFARPDGLNNKNRFIWQNAQLLIMQEKWREAYQALSKLPLEDNEQWYTSQLIALSHMSDTVDYARKLEQFVDWLVAKVGNETKQIYGYKLQSLEQQLRLANEALLSHQAQIEQFTAEVNKSLTTKTHMLVALITLLSLCLLMIGYRKFASYFHPLNRQVPLDNLTGLPSYSYLGHLALSQTHRHGTILLADIDNFAAINRRFSIAKGDEVLKLAANLIAQLLPKNCRVGRYCGDSFYIIAPDFSAYQAKILADRIRLELHKCGASIQSNNMALTATVAVGKVDAFSDINQLMQTAVASLKESQLKQSNKTLVV